MTFHRAVEPKPKANREPKPTAAEAQFAIPAKEKTKRAMIYCVAAIVLAAIGQLPMPAGKAPIAVVWELIARGR